METKKLRKQKNKKTNEQINKVPCPLLGYIALSGL
jgi:hypothetical protein